MSYLTQDEIDILQLSGLDTETPFLIDGVSYGQLSISRYAGGCKFNGVDYFYIQPTDELIRGDVLKFIEKRRKEQKIAKPCEQGKLL